ncbi:MAG: cytochrome P450 [Jatrophihabitans sp.]
MTESATRAARYPIGARVGIEQLERDPHQLLAGLREREPVSWVPALAGWLVTRHDLAQQVMRDAARFTVDDPRFSTGQLVGPSMLSLDGPAHARQRAPFASAFRPAEVSGRFTGFVADETARLLARLLPAGRAELRHELAGPLSVAVLAESLGLAGADPATVLGWYAVIVAAVSAITAGEPVDPAAGRALSALRDGIETGIAATGDSMLARAAGEYGLSIAETVSNAAVLMFGGIDTTEGMLTNLLLHLLAEPSRWAAVLADRDLIPPAVEESLRLEPAAAVVDRYATAALTLAGAQIRQGELVIVSIAGANRDPAVFDEPNRFDLGRANARQQLAFARGPHFCLGMDLARLEARTVLGQLLDAAPGLRLDPAQPATAAGLVFRKPAQLHVRWD